LLVGVAQVFVNLGVIGGQFRIKSASPPPLCVLIVEDIMVTAVAPYFVLN
jgi:hypothetical protein